MERMPNFCPSDHTDASREEQQPNSAAVISDVSHDE